MTRLELRIDEIVVHGFPAAMSRGLGPLVEERLAQLAGAGEHPAASVGRHRPVQDQAGLAGLVADRIWSEARHASGTPAGGPS
jgi:hypothetical protein